MKLENAWRSKIASLDRLTTWSPKESFLATRGVMSNCILTQIRITKVILFLTCQILDHKCYVFIKNAKYQFVKWLILFIELLRLRMGPLKHPRSIVLPFNQKALVENSNVHGEDNALVPYFHWLVLQVVLFFSFLQSKRKYYEFGRDNWGSFCCRKCWPLRKRLPRYRSVRLFFFFP